MSRGTKILIILLVIFATIGGGAFLLYNSLMKIQGELNAVVEPMITEMSAAKWNKEVMDKYSSPELKKWAVDHNRPNDMSGLTVLGSMKAYKGIKQFHITSNTAVLVTEVEFDTGDAYITLRMTKLDGKWLINRFDINSPALLPNAIGK